ncbi:serine/threonine-protein kinase [Streptomyces sp. NPDC058662]|uniref:serine/threonine-protein kinase n=1 Tax=Streptomyces sp. NPDC058662 TaxID=3346583 RepID=UPI0036614329
MSGNVSDVRDTGGDPGAERLISGRYRLLEPLGRGVTGLVWRARDEVLARDVAVKEVRAPAGLEAAELQRLYRRLEREAWAAARISHRGVVTVHDVASEDGRPWIVMELVRGLSLAEVLEAEGPMPPQRAAHIGEQVLAALRAAHDSGVLHGDVKPGNILLANDGRVLLSDFGVAVPQGSPGPTAAGGTAGSPEYLAPERVSGGDPGPRSDLWALGVLLYVAVEGISPFRRADRADTLRAVLEGEVPAPRRAGPLEPVLEGLLRKDPAARLSAGEAAGMLRVLGAGGAVRAPGGPESGPAAADTAPHRRGSGDGHGGGGGGDAGGSGGSGGSGDSGDSGDSPPAPAAGAAGRDPAPRPGRAALVLAVGVVFVLLAVGVLGWLLLE